MMANSNPSPQPSVRRSKGGLLGDLAEKVGGIAALAAAVGVSPATAYWWDRGVHLPQSEPGMRLEELARAHGVVLRWSGRHETAGEPSTGRLVPLANKVGGLDALAKIVGVGTPVLRMWNGGTSVPRLGLQQRLAELAQAHGVEAPFMATGRLSALASKMGTIAAVARSLGVHETVAYWWNAGTTNPSNRRHLRAKLRRLCALHGVPFEFPPLEEVKRQRVSRRLARAPHADGSTGGAPPPKRCTRPGRLPTEPGLLFALREKVGSARVLAAAVGVSKGTIVKWHKGRKVPALRYRLVLAMLAEAHGVEAPFALGLEGDREDRRRVLVGPLVPLAHKLGGLKAVAVALGTAPYNVGAWNRAENKPRARDRERLAALAREHGLEPPFAVDPRELFDSGPLAELAHKLGGVQALAEAAGVHVRVVRAWNAGTVAPYVRFREQLARLAAEHGLKPPFPVRLRRRREVSRAEPARDGSHRQMSLHLAQGVAV